jgi:hypothetical protein
MIEKKDKEILRELAKEKKEIGTLSIQGERFKLWNKLNKLQEVKPLVWITEVPWNEFRNEVEDLKLKCTDEFARGVEWTLRSELYQWKHFPGDMIVEDIVYSPLIIKTGNYGLEPDKRTMADGKDALYMPLIKSEEDADKIKTPSMVFDQEQPEKYYQTFCEIFDGIMEVKKRGIVHQWHAPWDMAVTWYGVGQLYTDMMDRPELVHRTIKNVMKAISELLDKQIELGLLDVGNGNYRVGSGGPGICDELPSENRDGHKVQPEEIWGCSNAQIFSEVSPAMHEEFALQYDRPFLERFGLSYYGCCEPLHKKIGILRSIKNLRKISMSTWINIDEASQAMAKDYVFSFKPNPAHLAFDTFDEQLVRNYLTDLVKRTRNNIVEVILKDITTVRGDPSRLEKWAKIAKEVVENI